MKGSLIGLKKINMKGGENMKRVILSLGLVLVLVMATVVPAVAAEELGKAAVVTVPSYISFTVTDTTPAGLQFGSMNPGVDDKRDNNDDTRAVNLAVEAETNVACNIQTKGEDNFAIEIMDGVADSGSTTTLVESGADYSGVSVGDLLINETDGSTATLTDVSDGTDTLTFTGGLSGGIDNTVATTDVYRVRAASPAKTFAIANLHWDTDNAVGGYIAMTTSYATIAGPSTPGSQLSQDVWHWLSVPGGTTPGDYSAIVTYGANES